MLKNAVSVVMRKMDKQKAHFQDVDKLPQEAEIHYLIRAVLSKKPNGFSHWMNCEIQNRSNNDKYPDNCRYLRQHFGHYQQVK